jgi:hypothetical protein
MALKAELAVRRADWPAALAALAEVDHQLKTLFELRPLNWQLSELLARTALLRVRVPDAPDRLPKRSAACAQSAEALQASVDTGQAGLVLEAWLAVRACSGAGQPDAATLQRLSAGGYRPTTAIVPTQP